LGNSTIANTVTYVLDAQLRVVPSGIAGELYIGGANLALGYLGQPDTTSEAFIEDPFSADGSRMYRTGDKVRTWDDGRLEFLGRCDQFISINLLRLSGSLPSLRARSRSPMVCVISAASPCQATWCRSKSPLWNS
jgi:non-ribosomal peptide synthetase component F